MGKKVYIGNLSYNTTEAKLRELFSAHGEVLSVNVVTDRYTGQPRGFAFVEMATAEEAQSAIATLNGREVDGRQLTVNEARSRQSRGGNRDRRDHRKW